VVTTRLPVPRVLSCSASKSSFTVANKRYGVCFSRFDLVIPLRLSVPPSTAPQATKVLCLSAMAAPSTEQRELQLVETVEFKILGVANKEDKLHQLLQRYLAPLILKAASDHASVRERSPDIVLPVKALLQQYKSSDSPVIKQLDLSFVQHSLDRLDIDDRRDLIPIALAGFSGDEDQPRAATMFNIILRLLLDIQIPPRGSKEDEAFRASIGLPDADDAKCLAGAIGIFLRLRTPTASLTLAQANPALSQAELALFSMENPDTEKIFKRLSELKAKLVTLLASGAFTDEEKFLPAVFAASSFDTRVSSTAEEIIKRSSVSMEDESLVQRLFQAHSVLPAAYRTRILGMLSKSAVSTTMSDNIMTVILLDFMPQQLEGLRASPLRPSSTLERTKLHKALFQYVSWVARVGPSKPEFTIGPLLIRSMRSYIESQGWPTPQQTSHDDVNLRSRAYETIGMLARSADLAVEERFELGAWLFRSLSEDPTNDTVVNIDGALSSLTAVIPPNIGGEDGRLRTMLLMYMSLPDEAPALRSTRHAVVKWANQCLPFSDIRGRWIDVLAVAGRPNERSDVVEQGLKGLDPWTYLAHTEAGFPLPDWKEMTITFFNSLIEPRGNSGQRLIDTSMTLPDNTIFQNFHDGRILAFPVALRYCKYIMMLDALGDFNIRPDWMQTLDSQVETDVKTRDRIRAYLRTIDDDYIVFYLKSCLEGAFLEDSPIVEECIRCFVQVASLSPGSPLAYLADTGSDLLRLLKSNNKEIRGLGARAVGILAAHPANNSDSVRNFSMTLRSLFANAEDLVGSDSNAAEGALLALGHLSSRCTYYDRDFPTDVEYPLHLLLTSKGTSSLHASALESFSQLWAARLALPASDGECSVSKVIEKLSAEAKKGNEKAVAALGSLSVGLQDAGSGSDGSGDVFSRGVLDSILKELFALHEIKRVEIQFTVGDAISAAIARWDSDSVKLTLDVEARSARLHVGARDSLVNATLDKLLRDCKATKPSLLKSSGIWLFCIVQYCSHLAQVQSRLREIQAAFMRLLSARDELVQETASRGLSLVYERGDSNLKAALIKDLVSAFTGSSTQLKVDNETELFEPGALPTGEGNSVTSYKDIVNLANEVGDQRLVYKFMSLAANAATWSTRSAFGRFGLSNILSESEVDPKLYPKLYRYRFDPNANVQRSMDDIWKALVKDSNGTLEAHFDAIVEDLLKSIFGREWRTREASCAALADLIQGRPFPQFEKYYRDIWTAALKVLDDVKGSVRQAALKLCMGLSNGLVRQLEEGNHAAAAKAMMKEALPFLLSDKGVESSVQDVQVFAAITVLKIAKHGGKTLRAFIPEMVPQLLGLLSTIEPQQVNWHYQRAGEDSRDQIDKLRSQMVNQSPISEAIEDSLRFVNADVMTELAPRLEATIKTAIGMPTKIGCSRVLTTLATRHAGDIQSVSGRFLQLLEKQVLDKNDEVSQAYARASAYMLRAAPDASKVRFCERSISMYFQSEDEGRRQKIADVVVALAKVSPDHFTAQETELLPFSYLGSHDCDEYTSKVFQKVWGQHSGSSRTVVRYVPEIVALVERCQDTAQWALRHTGAFTVAAMVADVASASDANGAISEATLKVIWPVLDKTLALKTFPGKEKLLDSYPKFVEQGQSFWKNDDQIAAQMKKIVVREAKRNNDEYRVHAFRCLWRFAKSRDDLDMLQEIIDITTPYLDDLKDKDEMEVDSKEASKEDMAFKTAKNALEAVARGYTASKTKDFRAILALIVKSLGPYLSSPKFDGIKRDIWHDCVYDLMTDATKLTAQADLVPSSFDGSATLAAYLESLDLARADAGTESQRLTRVKAVSAVLKAKIGGVFGKSELANNLDEMLALAIRDERALEVRKAWKGVAGELQEARQQGSSAYDSSDETPLPLTHRITDPLQHKQRGCPPRFRFHHDVATGMFERASPSSIANISASRHPNSNGPKKYIYGGGPGPVATVVAAMDEDISTFVSITGVSANVARGFLQLTSGDFERAVGLYFENPELVSGVGAGISGGDGASGNPTQSAPSRSNIGRQDASGVITISDDEDDYAMPMDDDEDDPDDDGRAAAAQAAAMAQEEEDAAMAKRLQEELYQGGQGSGPAGGDDDVRAPIARTTETLVAPDPAWGDGDDEMGSAILEQLRRRRPPPPPSGGPFGQRIWGDGFPPRQAVTQDDGPHARRLEDLFRPPYDLMARVSWDEARTHGKEDKKWILVNLQDMNDFNCQALNRDVWKDQAVRDLVSENFIFLQYDKDYPDAQEYVTFYFPHGSHENPDNYPHVSIVDPRTGEQVKVWSGRPFPDAIDFHAELAEFLDRYSLAANSKNPVAKATARKPPVVDVDRMTEEEMLEMALKNSLATGGGSGGGGGESSRSGSTPNMHDPDALTKSPALTGDVEKKGKEPEQAPSESRFTQISSANPHSEPAHDPATTTRIQFRHPDGRVIRRFNLQDPVRRIYEWLKAEPLEGKQGIEFELKKMPQGQDLIGNLDSTIEENGLKQGTVMIELIEE
ncbi:Proteasome component ECM29, partial [Tolypocladium capitatum]